MDASYYDGHFARRHPVTVAIDGDMFVISGDGIDRRDPLGAVEILQAIGRSPRIVRLIGGASCEIGDVDTFTKLLAAHSVLDSRVARWDRSWWFVASGIAAIAVAAVLGYLVGLPMLARATANRLPDTALWKLSQQIQSVLDEAVFSPTQTPEQTRERLSSEFASLRMPRFVGEARTLTFRHGNAVGANAMALPSGVIFVTDELVEAMPDDRLVLAVLAHEAGHVHNRHGLRLMIQSTVMATLVTWYIGDVSGLAAGAPTALLRAKYSRDLEREADTFAAGALAANGLPATLLVDALKALEQSRGQSGQAGNLQYLSSHPATDERIQWLNAYASTHK